MILDVARVFLRFLFTIRSCFCESTVAQVTLLMMPSAKRYLLKLKTLKTEYIHIFGH